MDKWRLEQDSLGEVAVPASALYGAQTQRARSNFAFSGQGMPIAFIRALIQIKAAAAEANFKLQLISEDVYLAIKAACDSLLQDAQLETHFPVDVFQTGSGTSTNMNANEVIARLASMQTGILVHPNDHVNFGQSSNDTIPSTIHLSCVLEVVNHYQPALKKLRDTIELKAKSFNHLTKTGRTHLMDAMPVRFSQSMQAWADQIAYCQRRLDSILVELQTLAQGGTAVGTGINTHRQFSLLFCQTLNEQTKLNFRPADNFFTHIGSQDIAASFSSELKSFAMVLMKIANDLRWMNSGPLVGLGEITLAALQPGSSIMPGKVNPVIPEAVTMVAAQVIGFDSAITIANQSSVFELNVMLPLIGHNLLQSIRLLTQAASSLADKAIATFEVNEEKINASVARNPILVTALNPVIGYQLAAKVAKQAYQENRPIIDVAVENTDLTREQLMKLLDPQRLTEGGLSIES